VWLVDDERASWSTQTRCRESPAKQGGPQAGRGALSVTSAPEQFGHRPVFAPETAEQTVSNRGERDKRALILLDLSGERSLHTGEVVGSIPTAPTTDFHNKSKTFCLWPSVSFCNSPQNAAGT
jgi:hypothetical protein